MRLDCFKKIKKTVPLQKQQQRLNYIILSDNKPRNNTSFKQFIKARVGL